MKLLSILCHQKKKIFSCIRVNCFKSSKEEYEKCEVEIIEQERYLWVNRKYSEVESDVANWAQIFDKCDSKKQKYRHELRPNTKCQQYRVFVRNDLVERKIKSCRKSSKRFLEF